MSTLLPTAVGTATLLPSADGNSPLRFSEKLSARTESIANATRVPRLIGAEKAWRPDRMNRLRGSGAPDRLYRKHPSAI